MHFHVPVMYFLPAAVVVVVVIVCAQVYMSLLAANSWSTSWMTLTCLPRTHLDLSPLLSSSVCGWTTVSGMTGRNRQSSISRLVLDRFCSCLAQVRSSTRKPWINSKAEFWGDAEFGSENRANRLNLPLLGNQTPWHVDRRQLGTPLHYARFSHVLQTREPWNSNFFSECIIKAMKGLVNPYNDRRHKVLSQ